MAWLVNMRCGVVQWERTKHLYKLPVLVALDNGLEAQAICDKLNGCNSKAMPVCSRCKLKHELCYVVVFGTVRPDGYIHASCPADLKRAMEGRKRGKK